MPHKRGNHEGSLDWFEQKQLWRYRFTAQDADGMTRRKAVYDKSQKEALRKGRELEEKYRKGLVAKRDGRTFEDFAQDWLSRKERSGRARNTLSNYRAELGLIKPALGGMKLQAIKPAHVRKLIDGLAASGYAGRTQQKVVERLRAIFKEAMRLELVYKNPAELIQVEAPPPKGAGRTLQPEEIERFLIAADAHPMGLFFRLVLGCGLRKGEALALTWEDVDRGEAELSITKNWTGSGRGHMSPPKTDRSRRIVPIPTGLLGRLEGYYKHLLEDFTPAELKSAYLFGVTKPYDTQSPNHALKRICEKHGLAPFRVHDLRHTYGSIMLASRIPLEVVSERMGHANPSITLNRYRHLLESERRGFVFDVEEVIREGSRPTA